jgi:hypothetical protein
MIRHFITTLLCLSLICQNALAFGLASFSMQKAQAFAGDDIELICTGKHMRYISVSATELEGQFVFITPDFKDEFKSPPPHYVDCTNSTLADVPQSIVLTVGVTLITKELRHQALQARIAQRPYTAFAYAAPHGRAPPHNTL